MTPRHRRLQFVQRRRLAIVLALLVLSVAVAAAGRWPRKPVLADILDGGVLRVSTLNAPTTYYQGREGPAGFEHDLASAFAQHLGVALDLQVRANGAEVLEAIASDNAHLAAAGLIATELQQRTLRFSPSYLRVGLHVICRDGEAAQLARRDLTDADIVLASAAAHRVSLEALEGAGIFLNWRIDDDASEAGLLEAVSDGRVGCTIVDGHDYALNHRYLPNLVDVDVLPGRQELAWALAGGRGGRSAGLALRLQDWFAQPATRTLIAGLEERYFGFAPEDVEDVEARYFRRAITSTLPDYRDMFESAAVEAGVPWSLLAAVGYQESHWDPDARSPTGVRGLMMLTRATAGDLGVDNRLDASQSVHGGARYLRQLRDRLPASIVGDERWWFAAAAYNVGYAHVEDARMLAGSRGLDANSWADVRTVLPLLEEREHYAGLAHGYARGREAQRYVRRVRDYADVLEKRFAEPIALAEEERGDLDGG